MSQNAASEKNSCQTGKQQDCRNEKSPVNSNLFDRTAEDSSTKPRFWEGLGNRSFIFLNDLTNSTKRGRSSDQLSACASCAISRNKLITQSEGRKIEIISEII